MSDTTTARTIRRVRHRIGYLNEELAELRAEHARFTAATGATDLRRHRQQLDYETRLAEAHSELRAAQHALAA